MADNIRVNKAIISTIEYYLGLIKSDWTAAKVKVVMAFDLAAMKKNYEVGNGDTLNIDTAALPIFDVSQQRELLLAFMKYHESKMLYPHNEEQMKQYIDDFISQ